MLVHSPAQKIDSLLKIRTAFCEELRARINESESRAYDARLQGRLNAVWEFKAEAQALEGARCAFLAMVDEELKALSERSGV